MLHLVVALDHVGIRRRWLARALTIRTRARRIRMLRIHRLGAGNDTGLLPRELPTRRLVAAHGAICSLSLWLLLRSSRARRGVLRLRPAHVVIRRRAVGPTLAILNSLVRVRLGVFEDNVPGVDEAGEETETEEGDVDERVCTAYPALDPY